jgi:rhodanese-related sulfurtransferase
MSAGTEPMRLERMTRRQPAQMTPTVLRDDPGRVLVDATWGSVQPMTIAPGVSTIGELELIEHLRAGGQLIDTRRVRYVAAGTIPGARVIAHTEIEGRLDELDPERPIVVFCNGPQCAATPDAVRRLIAAGRPAELILYYRGGIHDWVTLGLPLARGGGDARGERTPSRRSE